MEEMDDWKYKHLCEGLFLIMIQNMVILLFIVMMKFVGV